MAGPVPSKGRGRSSDRAKTLPTAFGTLLSRSGRLLSSLMRWLTRKRGRPKRPEARAHEVGGPKSGRNPLSRAEEVETGTFMRAIEARCGPRVAEAA